MSTPIEQLFDEARALARVERSQLALALLDSIEGDAGDEEAIGRDWVDEAHKRLALIAGGGIKTVPWAEAKARMMVL